MMIDFIVDMFMCLWNVNLVYYDFVVMLFSKFKFYIVEIFEVEGYILFWLFRVV